MRKKSTKEKEIIIELREQDEVGFGVFLLQWVKKEKKKITNDVNTICSFK